jgi:hypothetical protein
MPFRSYGPPISPSVYDEQIGLTFTQNFTSLEYNVTAVEQTDPTLGDGPAYLLSGVSNTGYWYQVGVSWNWAPGENPGTGFDMTYEVFDTGANSIFPANGQGGVLAFSGPVNAGDVIILNLYFSSSGQNVTMLAEDTNTAALAKESYLSMGATYFVGLPDSIDDQNGFFTGLMTEWYHGVPYFTNEVEVIYSNSAFPLSSAWMWMDEFNTQTFQVIFSNSTSAPVSYSHPMKLQEFSFNGTTEYSDAYEFVTGSLTNATKGTSSSVPLTLSFTVEGGGTGYSPPVLTYVSNGTSSTTTLTESPTTYHADVGTNWSVSAFLSGSTSSARWETDQPTSGLANSSQAIQFVYYSQDLVTFGFSVLGGGSGFSPPMITYVSFGSSRTTSAGVGVWADTGSKYQYPSSLSGSTMSERWYAKVDGFIGSSQQVNATYYHQYLVTFDISFRNTTLFPGLTLSSTSGGKPYSATVVLGTNGEWLDSGSVYSMPQSISLAGGDRLITNGTVTGNVSANLAVVLVYEHEFYVTITQNTSGGGTVSLPSGWYDSGSKLQIDAVAASGWQFEIWNGVGADSVSSSNASFSLTVGPGSPAQETAVFYPGVEICAAGPMSVSYSDGSVSGTVPASTRTEVYVPPSSTLSLAARNLAFLTTFKGWSGASNSSSTSTSLVVDGPAVVTSNSEYNYEGIGILVLAIALVAITATIALARRQSLMGPTLRNAPSVEGGSSVETSRHEPLTQADKPPREKIGHKIAMDDFKGTNFPGGCRNAGMVHNTSGSNPHFFGFKTPRALDL